MVTLVEELAGEQRGAQARVDATEELKEQGVAPADERRDRRRFGPSQNVTDTGSPIGIGDASAAELKMGHLAARKDQQRPALPNPADGVAQRLNVLPDRTLGFERIDRYEELPELHDALQVRVGENFQILAATEDDLGKQQPLDASERVIRCNHHRAGLGNVFELAGLGFPPDIHLRQGRVEKLRRAARSRNGLVTTVQAPQGENAIERATDEGIERLDPGNAQPVAKRQRLPGGECFNRVQPSTLWP